jgi:hypothetical protein
MEKEKKELAIANSIEVLKHLSMILRRDGSIDECFGGWLSYYPSIKNPAFALRNEYAAELKFVMEYLGDERAEAEKKLDVANSIELLADLIRCFRQNSSLDEWFGGKEIIDGLEPARVFRDAYADGLDLIIDFLKR